ncbi:integrator complex subunit 15 isoform X2 [Hemicordylus capensis]|uniref:integrator complex subunit 15 isoform X2 n=1 Tax=Hemicordylus capensis TaxID=884348 RepID=UPI0023023DBB|nr:integrator complex subunit 15 isoform X2 [Hemicordylus capensis]
MAAAAAPGRPFWPRPATVYHSAAAGRRWRTERVRKRGTMSDIRHSLLRRDALSAAKEVLYHLDIYFSSQLQNVPLPIVDKGPVELLEEFLFQIPKERGSQPKRMNSLQELQLLEIMCNYFQEQSKDSVRQIIFSSLFSPQGNKADDSRMALLGKLVSMAVAVCRVPVLECAASWLQRTPAVYCVRLAQALVDDYCSLVPGSVQTLKQIFSASPRFCCQFITSVTMLYDMSSDELIPPPDLLEMVVSWIFEDPRLILITFLNTPIAASLPIGFLELTPLSSLIRWCVKAPLAYKRRKPLLSNGHLNGKLAKDSSASEKDCHPLYSKLHLSVLQVLMMLQGHLTEKNLYGRLGLVPFEHVVSLVEEMSRLADELNPPKETELALDRLAQALQVAMASGALLCTREDLRTVCSRLPHNNLLQLVISGPVQQQAHAALHPGFYPPIHTPPLGYPTHPAHPAMPAHPALPAHPVQTFIPGVPFPYRPIR